MSADGYSPPPIKLHEPGIYLDLPMLDYVNDPAISGSGLKKLICSAPDFKWELPAARNPFFKAPESDAKALGTLVHAAVLEGLDVFGGRYFVAPELDDDDPRVIRTADHAKNWLKDNSAKCTGLKAELFDRVRETAATMNLAEDEAPIFIDEYIERIGAGRQQIKRRDHDYVAQVERFVRAWPEASALLSDGIPEISIFWTDDGVRKKARLDWLSRTAIVDIKKFGQAPMRGFDLATYLQREAVTYCYDIQAVHNTRAAAVLPMLLGGGGQVSATGEDARARIAKLETIVREFENVAPPAFHWLFLRTPGPPQGLIMPFLADCDRWSHCEYEIDAALANLKAWRLTCGDELAPDKPWIECGVATWDDEALPEYLKVLRR
jgi:hypothetical protein